MPTADGTDAETGEKVTFYVYLRNGKIVYERASPHLTDFEKASPGRLEAQAAFMEAASTAFGRRTTGSLPPAAEAVRAIGRTGVPERIRPERVRTQERYRQMVPAEVREQAERAARLKAALAENPFGMGGEVPSGRPPAVARPGYRARNPVGTDHPMKLLLEAHRQTERSEATEHPLKALLEKSRSPRQGRISF